MAPLECLSVSNFRSLGRTFKNATKKHANLGCNKIPSGFQFATTSKKKLENNQKRRKTVSQSSENGHAFSIEGEDCEIEGEVVKSEPELKVKGRLKLFEDFEDLSRGLPVIYLWGDIFKYITPLKVIKWAIVVSLSLLSLALARALIQITFLNPTLLMYLSWIFVVWPTPTAVGLGVWTLAILAKQRKNKAQLWEQLLILTGGLTWLILMPFSIFQGYIASKPVVLFIFYYFFFCISGIVRYRLWGKLSPKKEDQQWKSTSSRLAQIGFVVSLVSGHWLAVKESVAFGNVSLPTSSLSWTFMIFAFVLHWNAAFFLGKYFDRVVTPFRVVVFGPYRFVRHPLYTSYMALFIGYCLALRSYFSLAFIFVASALYYWQRVNLEEDLLKSRFEEYNKYMRKTPYKFLPWII